MNNKIDTYLIGCEFVHKCDDPFSSERRFIIGFYGGDIILDQNGFISSINSILLYPNDYSDPIPYKEWIKQINEKDVEG